MSQAHASCTIQPHSAHAPSAGRGPILSDRPRLVQKPCNSNKPAESALEGLRGGGQRLVWLACSYITSEQKKTWVSVLFAVRRAGKE